LLRSVCKSGINADSGRSSLNPEEDASVADLPTCRLCTGSLNQRLNLRSLRLNIERLFLRADAAALSGASRDNSCQGANLHNSECHHFEPSASF
jgi:hypothetical protein